ncbi:hypothetical protein D3C71_1934190 [compost metagenome]
MVTNSVVQIQIAHHVAAGNNNELFLAAVEIVTMAVELVQVTTGNARWFIKHRRKDEESTALTV